MKRSSGKHTWTCCCTTYTSFCCHLALLHLLLLLLQGMEGLSARERNRLKRKAKAMGRQDSVTRSLDSGTFPVRGGGEGASWSSRTR